MANLQFPIYQKSLCEDLKKTFLKRSTDTDSTRGAEEVVSEVSDMLSTDIAVYAEKLLKEMSGSSLEGLDRILHSKLDVDVFSELFTALDSSGIPVDLSDKDAISRVATIRANYGFWGVDFISALGKSTGGDIGDIGGGSGVEALYELVDVKPNASGDGVLGAKEGTALVYNGTYWVAGEAGLSETQLNSYLTTNEYVTKSDVYTKNDVYTKKEVDDLLAALKFFEKVNVGTDDSPRYALHILESMGLYSDDFISALGKSTTGGTGGGGVSYERLDSWEVYDETKSEWVLSAGLGYSLRTDIALLVNRLDTLEGKNIYWSDIKNTPSTLKGYGIVDAYTKSEVDELVLFEKVNIGTEENPVWAIHAKDGMGIYSDKFISALGVSGIGDTTGLYERLDSWDSYSSEKAEWVLSAYLGNDLNSRVKALEYLKSGHKIVVEGNGSIITNVEENVDTLTFSKGDLSFSKVVDKPNTLKGYGITDGVNSFEISGEGNAFTGCNIDGHKIIFTKGETFLPRATFDELFEKVNIGTQETPIYAIRAKYGFYSDGFVSAMGTNNGAGSPGLSYERLDNWSDYTEDKSEWVLSAALGYSLNTRVIALEELKKGHTISISGSGNVVTNVSENGNTLTFTKSDLSFAKIIEKPTTIAGYGITDAKISNGVITLGGSTIKPLTAESNLAWGKITGTPTTLSGYGITDGVNAYSVSGAGNAFTGVSISGHTITFTKGGTFLPKATFDDLFEKVNVGTTDSPVYAIRAKYGLYSDSFITAMGYGSSSTGVLDRLDNWDDYDDVKATWVLSAYLGNTLNERVSYLENNPQGHTIVINGSGNVLTNVVESGSKLTFTKGEIIWSKIKDVPLGTANGLATLDASGKVPSSQLPSYVDDVLECINKASFPTTGESGKIYIDQTTNLTYRWGGSAYVEISQSLALGETSSTAYAGDKGKKNSEDIAALKTGKADKATTLAGYGITDAYTKAEVNTKLTDGSVIKVGTKDVGSVTLPIYLKAGVPTAVGTSLAVDITGNSATATKLANVQTLWGQSFDGSANVSGNMTGVGTITPTGEDLKVVGNLIVTGGIVMYADDGATIESGFAALLAAHIDGVTIKYNESQQKIYSVMTGIKVNGTTYKPSETDGYITIPDYPTSLDWENIEGKPSTFTPASHTHTFASLTSKPTTLSGYGITDAKIVNGVITLGTATITPLTAHQTVTLASGTNNGTLKLTVGSKTTDNIAVKGLGSAAYTNSSAYATAGHTHNYAGSASAGGAAYSANKVNSRGNLTAYAEGSTTMGESGVNLYTVYNNGYPVSYGNLLHIYGSGAGQLLAEWCGNSNLGHLYYRSKRDNSDNGWSAWGKVAFVTDNVASASKWATARKITLTGSVTGEVSIDGSGNVTLATTTNHTHSYVPLSGGTMYGNLILKGGTSADMTYAGNVHPSIRFDNSDSSQNVSLIFTDYDSYRAPAGLKLVGNQGNEWFEAADIYATTFHGALSGNAATATTATKLGTATVGSGTQHFYLNAGTATASTSTVGGTAKPMYLKAGVMTAISDTVGGTAKPIFLNSGTLTAISATVGSASRPVYLNGGSVTACSYDFTSYLPLAGGTMGGTAWIVWPDSGNWDNSNSGVTFPVTRGGLHWVGQSDWVKLYSQETGSDNLNLVLQFGDDNSNGLSIRNNGGSQTAFISASGHITAANGTVNGTLRVGAIPVTNSSSGVLKIDGNLIVTGGITMYATDGVASGLMEQILVDGTTIKKKADGTLYADINVIGGGTVKGATVGGTAVTLDSATGILQFPAYPTLSSLGAAAANHTHSYLPLSGGTMSGYISAPNKGIIFYGSVGATKGAYLVGDSEGVFLNGYKYVTLESSSVNYHPRVRLNTVDYPLLSTYNYNSYVPTLTGTGASGTWGISISGNAATATNTDTVDGYHASAFALSEHTHSYLPLSGGTLTGALTIDYNHSGGGTTHSLLNVLFNGTHDFGIVAKFHSYGGDSPAIRFSHSSNKSEYNSQVNTNWSVGMRASTTTDFAITQDRGTSGWGTVRFAINNSGNVGIGIDSASYKLHVVGDIYTTTGFKKSGSSDSYVLLGGGGHKAVSDFATSGHTHNYLPYIRSASVYNANTIADGWADLAAVPSNVPTSNHGSLLTVTNVGTPYQIFIPDASYYIYKRYSTSGVSSGTWTKLYAGYADSSGSATKLTSSAGSATLPIYFSDGKPVACTASSVFSNLSNSGNSISVTVAGQNRTLTVGYASNADKVDGYHASSFTKKHTEYDFNTTGTAPYNYVWLCRIGNSNGYSGMAITLDVNSRYHKHYQINMLISTGQYAYSSSSISINKSDSAPNVYYVRTTNGSDIGYDYFDIYVDCGAWNYGGYKIANTNVQGALRFTNKCTLVDSLPSGATAVGLMYSSVNYATSAGNSDTCDGLHVHGGRNNEANKIVRTDGSGYLQVGYINSSSGNEGNNSSPARVWGTNGSDNYMRTYLTSALSVNYAASAGNADTVDGYHASSLWRSDGATWNPGANVSLNASANNQEWSFDIRRNGHTGCYWHVWDSALSSMLKVNADNGKVYAPYNFVGNLEGNAATASKWATARTITLTGSVTGSVSIDGSGNVTLATTTNHTHSYLPLAGGTMTGTINVQSNTQNGGLKFNNNNANLNAYNDQHLILGKAIRFGAYNTWDWNVWAGLKYDSSSKTIYLGLADGTTFNANSAQSGGSVKFPGVNTICINQINNSESNMCLMAYKPSSLTGVSSSQMGFGCTDVETVIRSSNSNLKHYRTGVGTYTIWDSGNHGSGSGLDADKLDGVHYENILDRTYTKASRMSSAGWYRIAQTNTYNGHGASFILVINRLFNNNNNEAYTFSVNITYSGVAITQISGYAKDTLIPKIRIDKPSGNNICYVDIYYNRSSGNDVRYFTIGNAVCISATANPTLVGTATEFSTSDGISTNKNILADGGITMHNTSDRRLKKNIRGFNACDELMKLGGVYQFEYIDEEIERNKIYKGSHIGLLYQNVKGTILDKMCFEREDGYGALNYLDTSFISLLAGVGVEHEIRLRGIEGAFKKYESKTDKKIRLMKKKINDLEARIKELEERRTA